MDYLVSGWNAFHFLLSPNELRQILRPYHMVIFNAHVPVDYTKSDVEEYLSAYSALYDLLLSGSKICWERDYPLFLDRGITSDLSNCVYGRLHEYEGKQYKSADFHEPVVGISPSTLWLHVGDDQKLSCSTAYSYIVYSECYMGVQLNYPKMIQYKMGEHYEALKPTTNLKAFRDFEDLKKSIKERSHSLTIKTVDGIAKRTNIWVGDEVKKQLNDCFLFQKYGITVK